MIPEKRKKLWLAFSEFYLDTKHNETDLERICKLLKDSNLSIEELKAIDLYEVFPVLYTNLLSPAGLWTGFDDDWLIDQCALKHKKRKQFVYKARIHLLDNCLFWIRKSHWKKIEKWI